MILNLKFDAGKDGGTELGSGSGGEFDQEAIRPSDVVDFLDQRSVPAAGFLHHVERREKCFP